jgi:hypothetical protein
VGSSKRVQSGVIRLSETVRLRDRDPWAADEDEAFRSGGELLEELACADFERFRDVRHCLSSYNPH